MRRFDLMSALFFLALGVWVCVQGFGIGFGEWGEPGPGFIAILAGTLLGAFSAARFLTVLLQTGGDKAGKPFRSHARAGRRVGTVLGALTGFTALLTWTGFPIACFLLLTFLFTAFEPKRWRFALVMAAIVTVASVVVFKFWLQVQFPEGPVVVDSLWKLG